MDIELDEGRFPNAAETVDFPGLDDQNVSRSAFEFLSVDDPESATFPHELYFIVRVAMRPWAAPREGAEEEHGHIHVAVIGSDEVVRTPLEGQVLLTNAMHPDDAPINGFHGEAADGRTPNAVSEWRPAGTS